MSEKELNDKLGEMNLELSKERASSEVGTAKNPGRIRELRRAIARIKTASRIKEKTNEMRGEQKS